ncbi:hypothetical protein Dip510_001738 [Elusimicrobium posterum]|uniref:hypothetical protein n=1 Tax=Elusimicrobium posterum TaxID=3116653 RepID=UPI003C742328
MMPETTTQQQAKPDILQGLPLMAGVTVLAYALVFSFGEFFLQPLDLPPYLSVVVPSFIFPFVNYFLILCGFSLFRSNTLDIEYLKEAVLKYLPLLGIFLVISIVPSLILSWSIKSGNHSINNQIYPTISIILSFFYNLILPVLFLSLKLKIPFTSAIGSVFKYTKLRYFFFVLSQIILNVALSAVTMHLFRSYGESAAKIIPIISPFIGAVLSFYLLPALFFYKDINVTPRAVNACDIVIVFVSMFTLFIFSIALTMLSYFIGYRFF